MNGILDITCMHEAFPSCAAELTSSAHKTLCAFCIEVDRSEVLRKLILGLENHGDIFLEKLSEPEDSSVMCNTSRLTPL